MTTDTKITGLSYCINGKHYSIDYFRTEDGDFYLMINNEFKSQVYKADLLKSAEVASFWHAIIKLEKEYINIKQL